MSDPVPLSAVKQTGTTVAPIGSDGAQSARVLTASEIRIYADVYSQDEADAAFASLSGSYSNPAWITALAQSKITGLSTTLADKADLVGGVVPSSQIPAIAISEYLGSVVSQAAMLALVGDRGDWCLRSDLGTTWVLSSDDSSLLASWTELNYPTAPVTSVNGQTGAVSLIYSDVGAAAASHTHGNITSAGAIGSTSGLPIITTTSGVLTTGAFGTSAGTFAEGNDSRITGALSASTASSTYVPLVRTLNGVDLSANRTISVGTSGTDANWSGLTLNIPDASASARGLVTADTQTIAGAKTFTGDTTMTGGFVLSSSDSSIYLSAGGSSRGVIYYSTSELRLFSGTYPWVIESNSGFKIRNTANTANASLTCGTTTIAPAVTTSGSAAGFTYTDPANTTQTASTEATSVNFDLSSTKQFANGAITTQRAFRIQAPVYSHVSGSNTITTASTLSISGPPTTTGGFTTITNAYALNVESGASYFAGAVSVNNSSLAARYSLNVGTSSFAGLIDSEVVAGFYNAVFSSSNARISVIAGSAGEASLYLGDYSTTRVKLTTSAAGILEQRNSTVAQTFRVAGTWTSTTSYELINIKGKAGANFEIGPENGSAGGTLQGLTIGGYSAGSSTITPWLTFTNAGAATFSGMISTSNSGILLSEVIIRRSTAGGIIEIADNSENFNRLQLGGRTSAYPAIKRSSAAVALRLADDSADAALTCAGITASDSIITNGLLSSDRYAVSANYRFRRANGTSSSPTQVTSGQAVGALSSFGYHNSGAFHSSAGAIMYFVAAESFTSSGHGTNIQFWTTPTTSTTSAKRVTIEASGELTLEAGSHIQTSGNGIKIGTATSQKLGFWNATPVIQQVLATGAGATVDNVITFLQTIGLCKQS